MIKRLLIDIQVKSGDWKGALDDCREVVTRAAKKAIEDQASSFGSVEVSIVLANDMFVTHLNKQYRNQDVPTNVLSFPNASGEIEENASVHLGDVVLALETCYREFDESKYLGKFSDHICHLVIHGVLHLLGYDHETKKDAYEMEGVEIKLLKKLGIPNPYLDV